MDSSVNMEPKSELQNPNAELHPITSQKSSNRQCILRRRVFKRQRKSLSKLEREFESLLSISPTTKSTPKPRRYSDPKLEVQRRCLIESQEFLRNVIFDREGGERESFDFFRGLFERDETLREIYANDSEICMFLCLGCGGGKETEIYGSCHRLVQHACTVGKTKKVGAHRAFGRVVCEVLGWDVNRYMSKSKVGGKWIKSITRCQSNVLHSEVATMCYNPHSPYQQVMPSNRSCNGMELDFQVDTDNRDKSNRYDEIVGKLQELNFNATFSAAECNKDGHGSLRLTGV